jgi:low affinity Fe/Cu permease
MQAFNVQSSVLRKLGLFQWLESPMNKAIFTRITEWSARTSGHPNATLMAFSVILIWAATGPLFHYSDTWQLVINTITTLVTFLMVFLIQSSQNRDTEALQIKLDEIIRALAEADNALLSLEKLDEKELDQIRARYDRLAEAARKSGHRRVHGRG